MIERKFAQKGWTVGYDSKSDYCPSCTKTRESERRAKRLKPIKVNEAAAESAVLPQQETPMNGAEQPQPMSRSDRRIIHAKLEEVYLDEQIGYKTPWTDAAVARDLGSHIPVAWVAEVRETSFGPAKDNEEIRDMLVRVTRAAADAKDVLEDAKVIRADVEALTIKYNGLMRTARDIAKSLDGLLAIAERVERSVKS